ncbi:MAG: 2-oxoglutarate dehydrogenase complex dihydrolipoyllysine-residue succinyltransferase [Syntrophobacteraceae bacterium]
MKIEIRVPSVGESVQEALLTEWCYRNGEMVKKDEVLFVLETDKVTLEVPAESDGVLEIMVKAGETVTVGALVGMLDASGVKAGAGAATAPAASQPEAKAEPKAVSAPATAVPTPPPEPAPAARAAKPAPSAEPSGETLYPSVRRLVTEKGIDPTSIEGTGPGGRVTKGDVLLHLEAAETAPAPPPAPTPAQTTPSPSAAGETVTRKPMTRIRQRIAERLLEAKHETAMLTTFNEIDMSRVLAIRAEYKEAFRKKHGVALGMMSFFIKASVAALLEFPEANAFIDGKDLVHHHYCHVGVAVGADRGLVVPVIRHAEALGFAEIEQAIVDYVQKINDNKLELSDLEGGTFTVTNGGVFGSLLSTPILNPPQSAILGMHKIEDRPIALNGQVVIRPMMYVALSYDHRIIDGKGAVSFLKRVKECIENPERMMLEI